MEKQELSKRGKIRIIIRMKAKTHTSYAFEKDSQQMRRDHKIFVRFFYEKK